MLKYNSIHITIRNKLWSNPFAFVIYDVITSHRESTNYFVTTPLKASDIIKISGLTKSTVFKTINYLVSKKTIEKTSEHKRGLYTFKLIAEEQVWASDNRDVYFVQGITTGHIKIGTSYNVVSRLANMQTNSSEELNLLGIIKKGGGSLEKELHQTFGDNRIHGEWFSPSPRLLSYIQDFT